MPQAQANSPESHERMRQAESYDLEHLEYHHTVDSSYQQRPQQSWRWGVCGTATNPIINPTILHLLIRLAFGGLVTCKHTPVWRGT